MGMGNYILWHSGPALTSAPSHNATTPVPNVVPFGFLSISAYLGICFGTGGCSDLVSVTFTTSQPRILITPNRAPMA